jgi:hypothetical protein
MIRKMKMVVSYFLALKHHQREPKQKRDHKNRFLGYLKKYLGRIFLSSCNNPF